VRKFESCRGHLHEAPGERGAGTQRGRKPPRTGTAHGHGGGAGAWAWGVEKVKKTRPAEHRVTPHAEHRCSSAPTQVSQRPPGSQGVVRALRRRASSKRPGLKGARLEGVVNDKSGEDLVEQVGFGQDHAASRLRYRRQSFSDSLRDENDNIVVCWRLGWRTTTVRVKDRPYVETREAGTRKHKPSVVAYLDASTRRPMVVVSGNLSKGDLRAQICAPPEEQFEFDFSRNGNRSNTVVRGTSRSGEPVLFLRFLEKPLLRSSKDIEVLLSRDPPRAGLLLIAYSVAQHWHRSRYEGGGT
jgi:hypothetical protein